MADTTFAAELAAASAAGAVVDGVARRTANNDRFRRLSQRAPIRDVRDYPVMASPPTIEDAGAYTTVPSGYGNYRVSTLANPESLYTIYGGVAVNPAAGMRAKAVSMPSGVAQQYFATRVASQIDADIFYVLCNPSTFGCRFLINGQYVSLSYTIPAGGSGIQMIKLTLPSVRQFRLDVEGGADFIFQGLLIPTGRTIRKVDTASVWREAFYGDSTAASTIGGAVAGASSAPDGYNVWMGKLLGGIDYDPVQIALGSTGVITAGQYHNAMAHIDDLGQQVYHGVTSNMGINDTVRAAASFTGSISGDVLTVTAIAAGNQIRTGPGGAISGFAGLVPGTEILRIIATNGVGIGTYRLNTNYSSAVSSTSMFGTAITASDVTAAYLAWFQGIRQRAPFAYVTQLGVSRGDTSDAVATEAAIKAAFDIWADPNGGFVPYQLANPKLFTGNAADPDTGNARFYFVTTDNVHAALAGQRFQAGYTAEAIRGLPRP